VVDIAILPWVRNLVYRYDAGDLVEFANFPHVDRTLQAFLERPAVQRGLKVLA
jgi:GST-like protein